MVARRAWRMALAGTLLVTGASASAHLAIQQLSALNTVERGQWQLKEAGGAVRKLCVANPAALLQLYHGSPNCPQTVVDSGKDRVTVHYSCRGRGYGRTTLTVETPALIRLETQGVLDGMPFASDMEGRKTGGC